MIEISSFRTCVVNFGFDGFFYKCTCIELGSIGTAATCLFSRILSVKFNERVKCLCPSIPPSYSHSLALTMSQRRLSVSYSLNCATPIYL